MSEATLSLPVEETAAILDELAEAAPDAPPEAIFAHARDVRPFALGVDSFRPAERLTGLDRMGEKIARSLRMAIEPFYQVRTPVVPLPLVPGRFGTWLDEQPELISLSHYRLRPLKGGMLIAIPASLVTGLIERFYGGGGGSGETVKGRLEFTASEELLLARLIEKLVAILLENWREVTPVEASLAQRETSTAHIGFLRSEDTIVVQDFELQPADGPSATISIVYPLAMLRPIEEQMAMRVQDEAPAGNGAWRHHLAAALAQVKLPVRSVLARPQMTVGELMALKPGDVIPIQLAARTPLLVAARALGEGAIGEQEGRAALLIEKMG